MCKLHNLEVVITAHHFSPKSSPWSSPQSNPRSRVQIQAFTMTPGKHNLSYTLRSYLIM